MYKYYIYICSCLICPGKKMKETYNCCFLGFFLGDKPSANTCAAPCIPETERCGCGTFSVVVMMLPAMLAEASLMEHRTGCRGRTTVASSGGSCLIPGGVLRSTLLPMTVLLLPSSSSICSPDKDES